MISLVEEIEEEARTLSDPERQSQLKKYFKEPIETYGLTMTQVKELARKYHPRVKNDLNTALSLTEALLRSGNLTLEGVGLGILDRFRKKLRTQQIDIFDKWVDHLNNWATTDHLATHMIATSVAEDSSEVERLMKWTGSSNRWRRRAAAVSLVPLARKGILLDDVLNLCDKLMEDPDDMVQKGVGWLLKEASKKHPVEVRGYLLRWRTRAPALVLRIGSEKLPKSQRVLKTRA